jgi:hypothetical protein
MDCAGGVRERPGVGWAAQQPSEMTKRTLGGNRRGHQVWGRRNEGPNWRGLVVLESL